MNQSQPIRYKDYSEIATNSGIRSASVRNDPHPDPREQLASIFSKPNFGGENKPMIEASNQEAKLNASLDLARFKDPFSNIEIS